MTFLILAGSATGAPVVGPPIAGTYGGTVTYVEPGWERLFHTGDDLTGEFRYNVAQPATWYATERVDYKPDPGGYEYHHYLTGYLTDDNGIDPLCRIYRNGQLVSQTWWDCMRVDSGSVPGLVVAPTNGAFNAVLTLADPVEPYPADGIVDHTYGLSSFRDASFAIYAHDYISYRDSVVVRTDVQWIRLGVAPEPATLTGAILGAIAATYAVRRRRGVT